MKNQTTSNKLIGKICVSVAAENVKKAITIATQVESQADVIEIRLDYLVKPAIDPFMQKLTKPLLFTNRPLWEGGNFNGGEAVRISLLIEAIRAGAAYIDIELRTDIAWRDQVMAIAKDFHTKAIVSWHDFKKTPPSQTLAGIFYEQRRSNAAIGKIVTMAHSFQDVIHILRLQELVTDTEFSLIAFCMGKKGIISRIATLELGGYMTYGRPADGADTAPGQIPATAIRTLLDVMRQHEAA